jgi:hypothetical protein
MAVTPGSSNWIPSLPGTRPRIKEWHVKQDSTQAVVSREAGTTLSNTEAVRRAVEALGYQAEVTAILDYVREHFGIDPSTDVVVTLPPAPAAPAGKPPPRRGNRTNPSE